MAEATQGTQTQRAECSAGTPGPDTQGQDSAASGSRATRQERRPPRTPTQRRGGLCDPGEGVRLAFQAGVRGGCLYF